MTTEEYKLILSIIISREVKEKDSAHNNLPIISIDYRQRVTAAGVSTASCQLLGLENDSSHSLENKTNNFPQKLNVMLSIIQQLYSYKSI